MWQCILCITDDAFKKFLDKMSLKVRAKLLLSSNDNSAEKKSTRILERNPQHHFLLKSPALLVPAILSYIVHIEPIQFHQAVNYMFKSPGRFIVLSKNNQMKIFA